MKPSRSCATRRGKNRRLTEFAQVIVDGSERMPPATSSDRAEVNRSTLRATQFRPEAMCTADLRVTARRLRCASVDGRR
jgi:hypothetical protein